VTSAPFDWDTLLDRLSTFYRTGDWRIPYLRDHAEDPFQVLIGTVLSQRTRDEATDVASARLFAQYPDADSLAAAPPAAIEPLIRGTGFYHTKARVIRDVARGPSRSSRASGGSARRPPTASSCSGMGSPRSPSIPTFTASPTGWAS
jgi:endonuclease III-like uncharacterized protein